MKTPKILATAGGVVGAVALAALAVPMAYAEATPKGSAFGVKVDVAGPGGASLASVSPMPKAKYRPGDDNSVARLEGRQVVDESHGMVSARALNAASDMRGDVLGSRASVTDLRLAVSGRNESSQTRGILVLTADLVTAKCASGPDGTTGSSRLANVYLAGLGGVKKKLVGGTANAEAKVSPNTTIKVAGLGKVVLNEQIKTDHGIVVNAVHVYLDPALKVASGEIIVSQATCQLGGGDDPSPEPSGSASASPSESGSPGEPTAEPSASETGPGGDDDDDLPTTGFKLALFAGIGASMVAAGAVVVWLMRRRRTAEQETADTA